MSDDKNSDQPQELDSPDQGKATDASPAATSEIVDENTDLVDQEQAAKDASYRESMRAVVMGEVMNEWPQDLFIPPDALEVVLESFEGPLDLLLYLIRKQNLDILIRRLQEYERFSEAANQMDDRPRLDRDIFKSEVIFDDPNPPEIKAQVTLDQLVKAFQSIVDRADANKHMFVSRDTLSLRERMTNILQLLQDKEYLSFGELFSQDEGRLGVVVSFIALLELFRDDMLVVVQYILREQPKAVSDDVE